MKKIERINVIAVCVIGIVILIGVIALMISQSNKTKEDVEVQDLGTCKLFINLKNSPFIYITANGKYIINFNDKTKNLDLYDKLKQVIK